jgi:xylulokinase
MAGSLLGLDIGTLGVKGVVVTIGGRVLARARRDHDANHPRPGWTEHDAERQWWGDTLRVIHELLAAPGVDAAGIVAVGISGLTPCLCLLDNSGRPLRPAILYSDNRALAQLAEVNRCLGASLTAQAVTPKLRWLAENEPEVVARAAVMLSSHNYAVLRLTGRPSMDYDTASIMGGIFDVSRLAWDEQACAAAGLDARLLPPLHPVTGVVGGVTSAAAAATGLVAGTPVIAGTGDTFPTMVGCGAIEPGDAMISFGTTGLLTLTRRPLASAAAGPHFDDASRSGAVTWVANVLTCGAMLAWYRDELACRPGSRSADRRIDFAGLDALASRVSPGAEGLIALPHWSGRRTPTPDPDARGVLFGLTPAHTPAHIYRALLESFGYALHPGFAAMRDATTRVVCTAGGAASPLWRQIVADILATPVEYHPAGSGALGIAFLAGYATGRMVDFGAIKSAWLAHPESTQPDPEAVAVYGRLQAVYNCLEGMLGPAYQALSAAVNG